MHHASSNCEPTEHYRENTPIRKSGLSILKNVIDNKIVPKLYAEHADQSIRSAFKRFEANVDSAELASRILAEGGQLPIIIDELALQACTVGALWEEDRIDFFDVTTRVARLQMIALELSSKLERTFLQTGHSILLMPCPHETHVFGLQLLELAFRDAGWAVTRPSTKPEWPGELLARSHYDAVGLSLSNEGLLPLLRDEIPRLRRASRNQSLRVLVGGPCFDRGDADFECVGADAYAPDACSAPTIAAEVVNEQKLICTRSAIS